MRRWTGWFNRPILWLVLALVAALAGLVFATEAARAFSRPAEPTGIARCDRDFDTGCLTSRDAVPETPFDRRGNRFTGIRTWRLDVQGDWPRRPYERRLELELRSQAGRDELGAGITVEVVFAGSEAVWVRLPSGTVLETTAHPWQAVPSGGFLALMFVGGAVWATDIAVRSARRRRSWVRAGHAEVEPGIAMALFGVGALGVLVQFGYPRPTPLGVAGLVLTGWVGWVVVRHRHRLRRERSDRPVTASRYLARRRRADLMDELTRLTVTAMPGADRRNGHLAVVVRPSAPRQWALDSEGVAAAAGRALAARGRDGFAPDLTAGGWIRVGDGVRLTRGIGVDGRADEDGLLEVSARDDGTILLACGRGTSYAAEPSPVPNGGDPAQGPPVVLPALLLGLTQAALLLAAELSVGDPPQEWTVGVRIDRLRGAVTRESLLVGGDPLPLDRDSYVMAVQASAADVPGDFDGISRRLLSPLLRDLGVADAT
ncbi:hypothetical protein [Jiangella alba]|uniref:Uncharacterized protein n=1 Tax=Jiangella alba TaxID=561176 RepID=A0A1H5KNY4_9ACTN|nr:hypothetical protein [Jiangella alba]SEE65678.1 hypothetical protein SAMN04488561_2138 [Jiangella alba]